MKVQDKKWIRFRMYLVAGFFLACLGIVFVRGYQLQVLQRDKLQSFARSGYEGEEALPPKRGTIYDREGHELAVTIEVGSIYAHPKRVTDKPYAATSLARILGMNRSETLRLLKSEQPFVWIKRQISPEKVEALKALNLEGIGSTTETRRYYPGMDIAAHVLGFTGTDNQGLEGLEKAYDDVLRGPQQTLVQMQDALGRPFFISETRDDSQTMHNLVLTIDKDIQYKVQQALQAAMDKVRGKSGQCIILSPDSGEILAMAVAPSFNPNIFEEYQPYQWRNRTVTDCYDPGSTIKAFLLAAALEENVVAPNTRFYCEQGKITIASDIIHDHDAKEYGDLTVSDIVVLSSNIGAYKIGKTLGYKRFTEYLNNFGFGKVTGIELIGERNGFVRPVRSAKEIDQANAYFGQGLTTTSLQIAVAMAAIANGGKLMRPYIVKQITDPSGHIIKETYPQMVRRVISPATAKRVTQILEDVVSEKGTGPLAAIDGYRVAGKTGTSQKVDPKTKRYSRKDYVAVFVGFAPANEPKIVVLVMIDEPRRSKSGGIVAGPVFRDVGAWTLNSLHINPEIRTAGLETHLGPGAYKRPEPRLWPKVTKGMIDTVPDFTGLGMREVLNLGRSMGLHIVLEGTGLAFAQVPGPGSPLKGAASIKVRFKPPSS
jgi:cell division protein FtsI (penicillin-binding protein 3)